MFHLAKLISGRERTIYIIGYSPQVKCLEQSRVRKIFDLLYAAICRTVGAHCTCQYTQTKYTVSDSLRTNE